MSWNEIRSRERVQKHIESIGEIDLRPLAREVSDLEQLLSETTCRDIFGAHVYIDVSNFDDLSSDSKMARDAYQRLIQATHIYQRELTYIAEKVFTGYRVHFQGAKAHILYYLPVNDEATISIQAALSMLVFDDFVRNVFNTEYEGYNDWRIGGGGDLGQAIGTRNGINGQRELLFIGEPANRAAKILVDRASQRITKDLYKALPIDIRDCCTLISTGDYTVSASQATLDALCAQYGIEWSREASAARIAEDCRRFPLGQIDYSDADVAIDFSALGWKNSKRVTGASNFADVSGFTSFVAAAEDDDGKKNALKIFHVIRKELAKVATSDYDGVHVQFQGDRIQTLLHLPKGDENAIAADAVETAIGMQSSFEQVIKPEFPEAADLTLKVGIDLRTTLATRLGTHGDRDNVCLGTAVQSAANIEERCDGSQIGISKRGYDALEGNDLQKHFEYEKAYDCWIARGLTWERIEALNAEEAYGEKALSIGLIGLGVAGAVGAAAYVISKAKESERESRIEPSRTYGQ